MNSNFHLMIMRVCVWMIIEVKFTKCSTQQQFLASTSWGSRNKRKRKRSFTAGRSSPQRIGPKKLESKKTKIWCCTTSNQRILFYPNPSSSWIWILQVYKDTFGGEKLVKIANVYNGDGRLLIEDKRVEKREMFRVKLIRNFVFPRIVDRQSCVSRNKST